MRTGTDASRMQAALKHCDMGGWGGGEMSGAGAVAPQNGDTLPYAELLVGNLGGFKAELVGKGCLRRSHCKLIA